MKKDNSSLEQCRVIKGQYASTAEDGNNGHFFIPYHTKFLFCIVSDGGGWEHVSIRVVDKRFKHSWMPDYRALQTVKEFFWNNDECVVQYFPAKADHINDHPKVLHLWKPTEQEFPMPPKEFV